MRFAIFYSSVEQNTWKTAKGNEGAMKRQGVSLAMCMKKMFEFFTVV